MNRNKFLALALSGTMLLSVSGISVAADNYPDWNTGKENVLSVISAKVGVQTEEHVKRLSALVKAAVQVAETEAEAQRAAEAAAAAEKAKQEAKAAEEKAKKEKEEAEKKAKEEKEKAEKEAAAEEEWIDPAFDPDTYYDEYYEQAYEALYADPVYYYDPYTDWSAASYSEPVYTEPVYTEPVYTEQPVYTETVDAAAEATYEEEIVNGADVQDADISYDVYADTDAVYDDTSYSQDVNTASGVRAEASGSDLDLLASIIFCEAGGESYEGQVAVGAVVLNRMESDLYPDDMSGVIYDYGQFTPAMTGWLDQVLADGAPDYCYEAAQAALNGENPVGDLMNFHAGYGDGLTIGNQTFY